MKWLKATCPHCNGSGLRSVYSANDFLGAGECVECSSGILFVSPKDRLALYPGGPFRGQWPGKYQELKEAEK